MHHTQVEGNTRYFRIATKDGEGNRKRLLIELAKETDKWVIGRKVNKEGGYIGARDDEDSVEVISKGAITSRVELIHDFKYGELVEPEKASQNQPEWGQ